MTEDGPQCCTAPSCCGPGSYCCSHAGPHDHDEELCNRCELPLEDIVPSCPGFHRVLMKWPSLLKVPRHIRQVADQFGIRWVRSPEGAWHGCRFEQEAACDRGHIELGPFTEIPEETPYQDVARTVAKINADSRGGPDVSVNRWGEPETPDMDELIERSSLGTPEAKAMMATVAEEDVARVVAMANSLEQMQNRKPPNIRHMIKADLMQVMNEDQAEKLLTMAEAYGTALKPQVDFTKEDMRLAYTAMYEHGLGIEGFDDWLEEFLREEQNKKWADVKRANGEFL